MSAQIPIRVEWANQRATNLGGARLMSDARDTSGCQKMKRDAKLWHGTFLHARKIILRTGPFDAKLSLEIVIQTFLVAAAAPRCASGDLNFLNSFQAPRRALIVSRNVLHCDAFWLAHACLLP